MGDAVFRVERVGLVEPVDDTPDAPRPVHGKRLVAGASCPPLQQELPKAVDVVGMVVGQQYAVDVAHPDAEPEELSRRPAPRIDDEELRARDDRGARAGACRIGER